MSVTVGPEDGVVLLAPADAPILRLDQVVRQKASWIVDRLRHVGSLDRPLPKREFISGESYFYLGRSYRLKVRSGAMDSVVLDQGHLLVDVEWADDREIRATRVRTALESWYLKRATDKLNERTAFWSARTGLLPSSVKVKSQRKRWGSCSPTGVLRFNWRIVQAPLSLIDYVVVHELVHLKHANHSKAFWAELAAVIPDFKPRKEQLRLRGQELQW